jgi:hypothetical protein
MAKTEAQVLIGEICTYLPTFLKQGNIVPFTKDIDATLDIHDVEKLLRIHFILRSDVIEFVELLPERIRSIKTSTRKENEIQTERIRGRIEWQQTIKERCSCGNDAATYCVERIERNYCIPENLVLHELLRKIYGIVTHDVQKAISGKYSWFGKWSEGKLHEVVTSTYQKNIYLRRIAQKESLPVTDRMIVNAFKSRNPLYRDAARLLHEYNRLMDYDIGPEEAKLLLQNTFIQPEKIEVLFELYWVIKVILSYTENRAGVQFHIIDGDNNVVAEWEDTKYTYRMYHDSVGSFLFHERWSDIQLPEEDGYLRRLDVIISRLNKIASDWIGRSEGDTIWGGRPDIILEQYFKEDNKLSRLVIGEVKYTESLQYATQGLRELLNYMALVKGNIGATEFYLHRDLDSIFSNELVKGWLFLDNVDADDYVDTSVAIVQTHDKEVENKLRFYDIL